MQEQGKTTTTMASLDSKYLMLYFSAHWCPPCRAFTPELVKTYNKLKESRSDVELIFISSDRDEASFNEYFGEMPWLALPFADRDVKGQLSKLFSVSGIPSLKVLGPVKEGGGRDVINGDAGGDSADIAAFPWNPKKWGNLSKTHKCAGSDIGEDSALVVFCENEDDDEQKEIQNVIEKMANERKEVDGDEVLYFIATENSGVAKRIRELIKMEKIGDKPLVVRLDIHNGESFVICENENMELTGENLQEWFDKKEGKKGSFGG